MSVATALLTVAFTMTSCIMEDGVVDEVVNADQKTCKVSLMLNLGNVTTRGSNSYSIGTEGGSDIENYINLSDLKLLIFNRALNSAGTGCSSTIGNDANDTLQQVINLTKIDHIDGTTLYNVTGELLEGAPSGSFRVVVAANWSKWTKWTPASKKLSDYCLTRGAAFPYPTIPDADYSSVRSGFSNWMPTEEKPIPMYGVKAFGAGAELTPSFIPGMTTDLGQIDVIRAVAKIELYSSTEGVTFSDVKLTEFMGIGMVAPYAMCEATAQPTNDNINVTQRTTDDGTWTKILHYATYKKNDDIQTGLNWQMGIVGGRISSFHNLSPTEVTTETKETTETGEETKTITKYVFYVPEYQVVGNTSQQPVPKLQFHIATTNDTTGKDYELEFKRYTNNVAFNILRNNIYRYEVTVSNTAVKINYNVIDWNDQTAGDIVFE
jgi:hypothetical protein